MRRSIFILLWIMGLQSCIAQDKAKLSVTGITQKEAETMELTITSDKPFQYGDNIHILHIGKKEFSLSKQSKQEGKGILTFFIPSAEFNALAEGSKMWLTYGQKVRTGSADKEEKLDELSGQNPKCWKLGKFSKAVSKK